MSGGSGDGATGALATAAGTDAGDAIDRTPGPAGTLTEWPLPVLFAHIVDHRLDGSLVLLQDAGDVDVVVFADGAPTRVRTARSLAPLGEMLVRFGVIANVDLDSALFRASESRFRLGQQLISEQVIDKRILARALREQVLVRLRSVAQAPATTRYEFHSNSDLLDEGSATGESTCDPLAALLMLVRAWPHRAVMDAALAPLVARPAKLHVAATPERFDLDDLERTIVERLCAGPVTFSTLLRSTRAPSEVIRALVYTLVLAHHLDLGDGVWPLDVEAPRGPVGTLRDSSLNAGVERDRTSDVRRDVAAAEDHREANALLRAGSLEAAQSLAARAVERQPDHPDYRAFLGYVTGLRASPSELPAAIAQIDRALTAAPRSDRALVFRAALRTRAGRHDDALADYRAAAAINPANDDAVHALRKSIGRTGDLLSRPPIAPTSVPPSAAATRWMQRATLGLLAATALLLLYYVAFLR